MSARIAPEPVSIAVSFAAQYRPNVDRSARPVESAGASADKKQNAANSNTGSNTAPQQVISQRPPGVDPSTPYQALEDANLIASQYRGNAVAVELANQAEKARTEAAPAETVPVVPVQTPPASSQPVPVQLVQGATANAEPKPVQDIGPKAANLAGADSPAPVPSAPPVNPGVSGQQVHLYDKTI